MVVCDFAFSLAEIYKPYDFGLSSFSVIIIS